jgi:hypothetical protein
MGSGCTCPLILLLKVYMPKQQLTQRYNLQRIQQHNAGSPALLAGRQRLAAIQRAAAVQVHQIA